MRTVLDCKPGEFYEVGASYLLPIEELKAGQDIEVGQRLSLSCMFDINFAMVGEQRVGYWFTSRFEVRNGGAYLLTFLRNKGPAVDGETLVKDENLVVYHFANKGTLAISPIVNAEIETIFQEQ
jgi:hypothetical protein